ncbi:Bifunctional riboflavin kinase/FMN adenylyltransferase (Riboflavin biosynthesis protein RibF) [Includes: Riboflavin kinase (Flavokinase) [Durusdinium trenchii]|uniref:Bifunctional riboflavin kinase/FMN adenylyltransferase n=1 Tax=Durusdinium trenchii TaxID=1381693 RepID=A0ABP0LTJ4_9DINO
MNFRQKSSRYGAAVQFSAGIAGIMLIAASLRAGLEPDFEIALAAALVVSVILHARAGFALSRAQQELEMLHGLVRKISAKKISAASLPEVKFEKAHNVSAQDAYILDSVKDAIENDRIDLYLQPIVSLPQRKHRYFEAFSRLRADDGAVLRPLQYIDAAERANRIGVIDNMILLRAVQALRNLGPESRNYRIFCNISPATIFDQDFFGRFTDYLDANADMAPHLVFEFTYPAVEMLHERVAVNLDSIARRGYAFSVDHIRRLDHDWKALRDKNFRFVKASSALLLKENRGEPQARERVQAFKEKLRQYDIDLIVEKVELESHMPEILSLGIDYGQGELFGAPRPAAYYMRPRLELAIAAALLRLIVTDLQFIDGLQSLAEQYDALLCDAWGVIHNGVELFPGAGEAMLKFREQGRAIVILTNAPRPSSIIPAQLDRLGLPREAYDAVVTSGDATRAEIERRLPAPAYRIGPEKDDPLFEGLNIEFAPLEDAKFIICTGLRDDHRETPEDYREVLSRAAGRGLPMVCANPDIVVNWGGRMIWCAGALAEVYAGFGGDVVYGGKPHAPIYRLARAAIANALGAVPDKSRILAIGDGLNTDIFGANKEGVDALFVAGDGGVHDGAADAETISRRLDEVGVAMVSPRPVIAAIGNFDGVHLGHQHLLRETAALAEQHDARVGGVVFNPHPRRFFSPDDPPFLLTSLVQRDALLREYGVEEILSLSFDKQLAARSPESFVREVLCQELGLAGVVTGTDFRFGAKRAGDGVALETFGAAAGLVVKLVDVLATIGAAEKFGSSVVREALVAGDVRRAGEILGRPWTVRSQVVEGQKLGRTLGFPTANVMLGDYIEPKHGVYAVKVTMNGVTHDGVANFGRRPTVGADAPLLEAHLLDFKGDLYGADLEVAFVEFIRDEQKFDGLDALKAQIGKDITAARDILRQN